ncbi:MAG: hypothetical protein HC888_09040 [Candidatus Competibacteraceae bacterium]|nr:hypothetical protein [Candidatus Competibacteraceae bacterium]
MSAGVTTITTRGTTPDGLNPVVDIAAGDSTSLALHVNGSVTAWGANGAGQVDVLPAHRSVLDIAGGYSSSNLLLADQTLSVLGFYSGDSTIDPPSGTTSLVDIKTGTFHNLGIHSDGTASGWGE